MRCCVGVVTVCGGVGVVVGEGVGYMYDGSGSAHRDCVCDVGVGVGVCSVSRELGVSLGDLFARCLPHTSV